MNTQRKNKFKKWWGFHHHDIKAHTWLVKHSKRCMHNYNIAPEQFDQAKNVMKRWNLSEYKRLNYEDAYFLWRLIHPTINHRRERLLATAAFFAETFKDRKFSK
jgi:hypothetical protein